MRSKLHNGRYRRSEGPLDNPQNESAQASLSPNLDDNEAYVRQRFQKCSDLVCKRLPARTGESLRLIVYLDTLADASKMSKTQQTLLPADRSSTNSQEDARDGTASADAGADRSITATNWQEIIPRLLRGYIAVLTDGETCASCYPASIQVHRSLEEPSSEQVIRGPKEGFIERQSINIGLLRNYIRTDRLKMEAFSVGELTETNVVVAYVEGKADESVVDTIRSRIAAIRIDGVLESGYIEEQLRDDPFPLFPTVQVTERPDAVAGGLLEGRVAVLVDNSPFVLVLPVTFWTGLQASEDYAMPYPIATFIRWVRFLFVLIAVFAPSLFVAVTTYHQEMIPTSLLLSIASAREPVPFPAMIEALLMEIMFEALREAGLRMPKSIGQTVSIVGGLVIGQAAVQAGIISTPILIVVSATGIAAFVIPRFNFSNGIRLLRFPIILLAGSLGLYGIALGFLAILLYLVHLKSFGVPYLKPVAPWNFRAFRDVWIRAPKGKPVRQEGSK